MVAMRAKMVAARATAHQYGLEAAKAATQEPEAVKQVSARLRSRGATRASAKRRRKSARLLRSI